MLAAGLVAGQGTATAAGEVETSISGRVLDAPHVVTAADGRSHMAYEIRLANNGRSAVTLRSVQARGSGDLPLAALAGGALERSVRLDSRKPGLVLGPAEGATIFMDVVARRGRKLPTRLVHRVGVLVQPPDGSPSRQVAFTGIPTAVERDAPLIVSPPLRGPRWLASTGCCAFNEHRGAVLPINGRLYAAQRFAVDFIQLTPDNRFFSGPVNELASFAYYGSEIRSVAAGRVVRVEKGRPQNVPGAFPADSSFQNADGNSIIVRIAPRRYALYAHLQSDSIKVRVGDRVARGQVIALLGNSGHSGGPHLHFHVMDGPSPLASSGVPWQFTSFTVHGQLTDDSMLLTGEPMPVDPKPLAGKHRRQIPLNNQLLSFG